MKTKTKKVLELEFGRNKLEISPPCSLRWDYDLVVEIENEEQALALENAFKEGKLGEGFLKYQAFEVCEDRDRDSCGKFFDSVEEMLESIESGETELT